MGYGVVSSHKRLDNQFWVVFSLTNCGSKCHCSVVESVDLTAKSRLRETFHGQDRNFGQLMAMYKVKRLLDLDL